MGKLVISMSLLAVIAFLGLSVRTNGVSAHGTGFCSVNGTLVSHDFPVEGTNGPDIIVCAFTDQPHLIKGGAGGDLIIVFSTAGTVVEGGFGSDFIIGGAGNDVLNGGQDADLIFGGAGDDIIKGGQGADGLAGGLGTDLCEGGPDIDIDGGGCEPFVQ